MTPVVPFTEPVDPLVGPCARCKKVYADHPGGFCPDAVGGDGFVDVMDAPTFVPADDEDAAAYATEGFAEFSARREAERAAADADYISVRKAILPGARPGETGFVARSGDVRAFVRPLEKRGYEFGRFDVVGGEVKLQVTGREVTLSGAKEAAVAIVREQKEKEETVMATATAGEKTAPAKKAKATVDTAGLRAALIAAIEEAVPGATRRWNKTSRYETFYVDTHAFGLVFKEGARTVSVKIPGQLREIKVSDSSGFTKSAYGLTRSVSKRGEIRSVAKVFATAADAAAKKAAPNDEAPKDEEA